MKQVDLCRVGETVLRPENAGSAVNASHPQVPSFKLVGKPGMTQPAFLTAQPWWTPGFSAERWPKHLAAYFVPSVSNPCDQGAAYR